MKREGLKDAGKETELNTTSGCEQNSKPTFLLHTFIVLYMFWDS